MSKSQSDLQSQQESPNESQETRRFDSDQIRASAPRPGLVLRERYRLDSEIGRGAMGVVYRATDLELLRPVAVKILVERIGGASREGGDSPQGIGTPRGSSADDPRSRFLREARAAAALNHPNIVAAYD